MTMPSPPRRMHRALTQLSSLREMPGRQRCPRAAPLVGNTVHRSGRSKAASKTAPVARGKPIARAADDHDGVPRRHSTKKIAGSMQATRAQSTATVKWTSRSSPTTTDRAIEATTITPPSRSARRAFTYTSIRPELERAPYRTPPAWFQVKQHGQLERPRVTLRHGLSCCRAVRRESASGRSRSLPGQAESWCSGSAAAGT